MWVVHLVLWRTLQCHLGPTEGEIQNLVCESWVAVVVSLFHSGQVWVDSLRVVFSIEASLLVVGVGRKKRKFGPVKAVFYFHKEFFCLSIVAGHGTSIELSALDQSWI